MMESSKRILATVNNKDKKEFLPIAENLSKLGYTFVATSRTAALLREAGIEVTEVRKINEEKPNILDLIENGEIDLVVNTPTKGNDSSRDGFKIRRTAIERSIPVITSIDTLIAITRIEGKDIKIKDLDVISL